MSPRLQRPVLLTTEFLCAAITLLFAGWLHVNALILASYCLAVIFLLASQILPQRRLANFELLSVLSWLFCAFFAVRYLISPPGRALLSDNFLFAFGILNAALLLSASLLAVQSRSRKSLAWLAFTTAFLAGCSLLITSYFHNDSPGYFLATFVIVMLIVAALIRSSQPDWLKITFMTLLLLLIGLNLTQPFFLQRARTAGALGIPAFIRGQSNRLTAVEFWRHDPQEWESIVTNILLYSTLPGDRQQLRLKPNCSANFFDSVIRINSRGFRGPEFNPLKGDAYRIVVLGESTTFDLTVEPNQKPWTEQLQSMINDRLHPSRRVEVINAGIPAVNLRDNLDRLPGEILPVKPDMIISYHGYNGFRMLDSTLPREIGRRHPAFEPRPIYILARAEYGLKLWLYKREYFGAPSPNSAKLMMPPLQSAYAHAYEQLAAIARTNNIQLVLANYSMAVTPASSDQAIDTFLGTFPYVRRQIEINAVHTTLLEQLARQHPDICLVDTHPNLDGHPELFLDLMHPSPDGDTQLAENIFAGITNVLRGELSLTK